jgi:hypothetical protein
MEDGVYVPGAYGQPDTAGIGRIFDQAQDGVYMEEVQTKALAYDTPVKPKDIRPPQVIKLNGIDYAWSPATGQYSALNGPSLDEQIAMALGQGTPEGERLAQKLHDFKNQPNPAALFQLGLEYAKSPTDSSIISNIARGKTLFPTNTGIDAWQPGMTLDTAEGPLTLNKRNEGRNWEVQAQGNPGAPGLAYNTDVSRIPLVPTPQRVGSPPNWLNQMARNAGIPAYPDNPTPAPTGAFSSSAGFVPPTSPSPAGTTPAGGPAPNVTNVGGRYFTYDAATNLYTPYTGPTAETQAQTALMAGQAALASGNQAGANAAFQQAQTAQGGAIPSEAPMSFTPEQRARLAQARPGGV